MAVIQDLKAASRWGAAALASDLRHEPGTVEHELELLGRKPREILQEAEVAAGHIRQDADLSGHGQASRLGSLRVDTLARLSKVEDLLRKRKANLAELEAQLMAPADPSFEGAAGIYATALLQKYVGLTPEQQLDTVGRALTAGDLLSAATLLGAPDTLHKLPPDVLRPLRSRLAEKRSPAQAAIAREQRRLVERVEQAIADAGHALVELTGSGPDPLVEMARGRAAGEPEPEPEPEPALVIEGGRK